VTYATSATGSSRCETWSGTVGEWVEVERAEGIVALAAALVGIAGMLGAESLAGTVAVKLAAGSTAPEAVAADRTAPAAAVLGTAADTTVDARSGPTAEGDDDTGWIGLP
jgi:hypothetical protein